MNPVYFDLETQHLFEDVGGRQHKDRLRLACAVTWSDERGDFAVYWEADAAKLLEELVRAERVVGFNIREFDFRVLQPYAGKQNLAALSTVDIMLDLQKVLGFRVSLDAVAGATLGSAKSADGRMAVEWFRTGELERLAEYCKRDVEITREIFEFGRANGHVLYTSRLGTRLKVPVSWA